MGGRLAFDVGQWQANEGRAGGAVARRVGSEAAARAAARVAAAVGR